jgi:hypothetical protein
VQLREQPSASYTAREPVNTKPFGALRACGQAPYYRRVWNTRLFTKEQTMKYIRKRSITLRRRAARRLRIIRKQLRKIDLSLSVEINVIFLKVKLTIKRREE